MDDGATGLDLVPSPAAPARVRRYLRSLLPSDPACHEATDNLLLAATELVTNAVLHAGTPLRVSVRRPAPTVVRVEVADGDPYLPGRRAATPDATSGRGLMIIESLGMRWGAYAKPGGKVVWLESDFPPPA